MHATVTDAVTVQSQKEFSNMLKLLQFRKLVFKCESRLPIHQKFRIGKSRGKCSQFVFIYILLLHLNRQVLNKLSYLLLPILLPFRNSLNGGFSQSQRSSLFTLLTPFGFVIFYNLYIIEYKYTSLAKLRYCYLSERFATSLFCFV